MKAFLVCLLVVACGPRPDPKAPPDGPGTCEDACTHLAELGGCGIEPTSCVADCHAEDQAETEIGMHFPRGCLVAAHDCKEAVLCR